MLAGEAGGKRHVDSAYIFIDTDQEHTTGFFIKGIGADYMVEVYGQDGRLVKRNLFEYTSDTQDWNNWRRIGGRISTAVSGSQLEAKLPYTSLNLNKNDVVDVLFYMQSWDGFEDFSDTQISNEEGVLAVTQRGVAGDVISGTGNQLMEFKLKAHNADITLEGIRLTRLGKGEDGDVSEIRLMDGDTEIASGTLVGGIADLQGSYTINEEAERTLYLEVGVGNAQPENSVGFRILNNRDVTINRGTVALSRDEPQQGRYEITYLINIPYNITIDGAFADWLGKTVRNDTDSEVTRSELDIAKYGVSMMDDGTAFFLKMEGEIAGGVEVPYRNDAFVTESVGREGPLPSGPPELPEEPKTGEDVVYVFLDTIPGPGYRGGGLPMTADYLIEVRGRYNTIISQAYYEWRGANSLEWNWEQMNTVEVSVGLDTSRMEIGLTWNDINLDPANDTFAVYFMATDWERSEADYSDYEGEIYGPTRGVVVDGSSMGYDVKYHRDFNVYFDEDSAKVMFETKEGYFLAWQLPGELKWEDETGEGISIASLNAGGLTVDSSRALWENVYLGADVSVEYLFSEGSLKENIIIEHRILGSESFDGTKYLLLEMPIEYNEGLMILTDGVENEGSLVTPSDMDFLFEEKVVYTLKAPVAVDADGNMVQCEYIYEESEQNWLTLRCPSEWLDDAAYPVKIDPNIVTYKLESGNATANGDQVGFSVAVGDFNGDNKADVLVGAKNSDYNGTDSGCAYIFLGPINSDDTSPDVTISPGTATYSYYGYSVGAGDFNNDGIDDAIVAGFNKDIYIKYGGSSLSGTYYNSDMDVNLPYNTDTNYWGHALAAGDLNASTD
ncbi:MAG: FG-GAP repeat protein, partial [Thermoplasmata archaeon]